MIVSSLTPRRTEGVLLFIHRIKKLAVVSAKILPIATQECWFVGLSIRSIAA